MDFKFNILYIIIPLLFFVFTIPMYAKGENTEHHYYDVHGNSLEKFDHIWTKLNKYYGKYLPKTISIKYIDKQNSEIDLKNNIIRLSLLHLYTSPVTTIAHETSHIALAGLTNGASHLNRFRFFDEGFASIIGAESNQTLEDFKKLALLVSNEYHTKSGIHFVKVQDWNTYFKIDRNPDTYLIGASFCFFYYLSIWAF